eukprot:3964710-Heterocapsa_arctica.AAC.1
MVDNIRKHLNFTAEFDGCAFGLQDLRGWPLRKPWRVATTLQPLEEALSWRCDGTHRHGVMSGVSAKSSAHYTPEMVDVIGRTVLKAMGISRRRSTTATSGERFAAAVTKDEGPLHYSTEEGQDEGAKKSVPAAGTASRGPRAAGGGAARP